MQMWSVPSSTPHALRYLHPARQTPNQTIQRAMTSRQAVGWMIACTLMWSVGGVLSRFFTTTEGFEVTFWRSVFAALTVLVWFAFTGVRKPLRQLLTGGATVWASGLMWSVMFTCFMFSLSLTTVANVLITQSLAPAFTALLAWVALRQEYRSTGPTCAVPCEPRVCHRGPAPFPYRPP